MTRHFADANASDLMGPPLSSTLRALGDTEAGVTQDEVLFSHHFCPKGSRGPA